ncbi:MAG: hypothetical protein RR383_09150 [Muribaculaceae bacterium]
MKYLAINKILGSLLALLFTACASHNNATTPNVNSRPIHSAPIALNPNVKGDKNMNYALPQIAIYKTVKPYTNNVPVTLDDAHSKIVSYPAPTDIYFNGTLAKPTPLKNGYWLDNRGINKNTAFTSYSYEEYSKLAEAPSMQELMEHIIDKNPITEIHFVQKRDGDTDAVVKYYNSVIDHNFVVFRRPPIPQK